MIIVNTITDNEISLFLINIIIKFARYYEMTIAINLIGIVPLMPKGVAANIIVKAIMHHVTLR